MPSLKSAGHSSSLPAIAVAHSDSAPMRKLHQEPGQVTVLDPATTLIRFPDVIAMTGLARATIYKRLKDDPTFPRPVPLSDSMSRGAPVGFVLAEVQRWTCARIEARETST